MSQESIDKTCKALTGRKLSDQIKQKMKRCALQITIITALPTTAKKSAPVKYGALKGYSFKLLT